jgi:hypothetical protein
MSERDVSEDFLWERGGAWIGFFGASGPLATLSGDRDALCISFGGQDHTFTKDRIVALKMYRCLFFGSLYIDHAVPIYPRRVKFGFPVTPWNNTRYERIKGQLKALGYEVME